MCKYLPILVVALCAAFPAHADHFAKPFNDQRVGIAGLGSSTCGDFSNPMLQTSMADWFTGFLAGVNATQTGKDRMVGVGLSFDTLKAVLDKYCREHPLEILFEASVQTYYELRSKQLGK